MRKKMRRRRKPVKYVFVLVDRRPAQSLLCRSWNRGRCSAPSSAGCRYRHACDVVGCARNHRGVEHNHFGSNNASHSGTARTPFSGDRPAKRSNFREFNNFY